MCIRDSPKVTDPKVAGPKVKGEKVRVDLPKVAENPKADLPKADLPKADLLRGTPVLPLLVAADRALILFSGWNDTRLITQLSMARL